MKVETTVITTNNLPAFAAGLIPALGRVVAKTGFDVVAIEQELSRKDTGAMANGWQFEMTGATEGINSNPVNYTPVHEFGSEKIAAQPMQAPALDQAKPGFVAAVSEVLKRGG